MKTQSMSARYDMSSGTITLSLDQKTFHNIHLKDGFEKAFDRLVEVLSEKFDVAVEKKQWVCDDACQNCGETGTEYRVTKKKATK